MRTVPLFLSMCVSTVLLAQTPARVSSPGDTIQLIFSVPAEGPNAGWLTYDVTYRGKPMLQGSRLGLQFRGQPAFGTGVQILSSTPASVNHVYNVLNGKANPIRDWYNSAVIAVQEKSAPQRKLEIEARAYEDGVAFRYRIPEQVGLGDFAIERELTQFTFAKEGRAVALPLQNFQTSFEDTYYIAPLSGLRVNSLIGAPMTIEVPGVGWASITEAHLEDWAGMYLIRTGSKTLETKLSPRLDQPDVCVLRKAPAESPWRAIMIAADPSRLIDSNLVVNLNPPSRIKDESWIRPGKTSWSWWSGDLARGVSFQYGMNTETMKHYIDFSSEFGLEYVLIDEGWSGDIGGKPRDITRTNPKLDLPGLIEYAKSKNVKIWLWSHWTSIDQQMDQAFPLWEKWGIAGTKVDFMDRNDQQMVGFYHRVAKSAAEHHLMLDFHGAYPPNGWNKYYPNVLTHEGVMGMEYLKWSARTTAEHNVNIAFTRLLAGPLDYTPGGFENVSWNDFQPRNINPMTPTTRAHQMALYVVFESGFMMLADYPGAYRGTREIEFLKKVPVVWDETRGLGGEPGQFVSVARRKGNVWYVGSITGSTPREVDLPLSFLGAGEYKAEVWSDVAGDPKGTTTQAQTVTRASHLQLKLAPTGGNVVVIHQ